jgi:hypothetical protein
MIELPSPEDRVALLVWFNRKWGTEFPVSGDTLAMYPKRTAYFGGVLDDTGFHALNRVNPGNSGPVDVNSPYPAVMK